MLTTQQQPSLDTPAEEQHPLIERVVEGARQAGSEKSNLALAVIGSYLCSVGIGAGIAYLFDKAFGVPEHPTMIKPGAGFWQIGIILSILTSFILGLLLPLLFARNKRLLAVLLTVILQFITLVALMVIGLSQLPGAQLVTRIGS